MKTLKEVRARIKELAVKAELSDEESEELKDLMDLEPKLALKAEAAAKAAKLEAEEKAAAEKAEKERIDAEVEKQVAAKLAEARRLPMGAAPYQAQFAETNKFDNLSPGEIGLVIDVLQSQKERPSEAAFKALAFRIAEEKVNYDEKELNAGYSKGAFKAATGMEPTVDAIKAATDPMYTGGSGVGSQWVGTAYARELWRVIRAESMLAAKFPSVVIPDGFSSTYFPLESTDPTWYKVAEATASDATLKVPAATITASQAATGNKQLSVGKMGARVLYTGELTEDSLVAFAPQLREQLQVSGQEIMEHIIIDGDTATASVTNINDIGDTSAQAGSEVYLLANGLRKLALVTNTANSRSGGTLDEDDYLETMFLMGTAGLAAADMQKCAFVVDANVYKKSLQMASVKTKDVWANATLENGVLKKLWGYNVHPSWQMHRLSATRKANTDGKVHATNSNNTTGSIVGVRFDQWKLGYKRRMTIETTRIANADSWEIVALARWGLAYRDNEASAITYNLAV
jgi:hypothetical protein